MDRDNGKILICFKSDIEERERVRIKIGLWDFKVILITVK